MPLAKRIIPTLLARGDKLVKGIRFDSTRIVGHVQQAVEIYQVRGVDELVILDVAATREGRGPDINLVKRLAENCFMPLAIGGGVCTLHDIHALLNAGADKVMIGTAALNDPKLIYDAAKRFGSQAIVVSIDVGRDKRVTSHYGTVTHTHPTPVEYAKFLETQGAGEILLQAVERDGTMQGYDLTLIREISGAVSLPVIASCGCGTYEHMHEAIQAGADAVAAGAMFQWADATPGEAAEYLAKKGIEVRHELGFC
jgi:cyclase